MTLADLSKAALAACLFPGLLLFGADDTAKPLRRLTIGIHVNYFPLPLIKGSNVVQISNNPVEQDNYFGSSDSPKWGPGAMVEYRLLDHVSLAGEIHFHHVDYSVTDNILSGYNTSTTGGDNRPLTTTVQTSQVNNYEIPIVAHYYGLWSGGWKRRLYVSAGGELLHVGRIRTGNDFIYPSGAQDYNENPAIPNKVNDLGGVVGVGMRFVDEFHIRLAPEVRFIRWQSPSLLGPAYRSAVNQLEAEISVSF
ncbi:MAG: hypothetical protein ABSF64_01990 [Bryobacteraceae bacterium]|jgi:hypothetical protein